MLRLLKTIDKKDLFIIVVSTILICLQVFLDLKLPDYMSNITRLLQTGENNVGKILEQGGYMLLSAGGSLLSAFAVGYLSAFLASNFSKRIRSLIFEKVKGFGMEEIKAFSTSSLITRTTNDVTNVEMYYSMGIQMLIKSPITAVWAIFKILNKSWQWSLVTAVAVVLTLSVVLLLITRVMSKFKLVQKLIDNVNEKVRENLIGIKVIRAFNAEKYQENKFEKENNKLTNLQIFIQRVMGIMQPMMYFVMNTLTVAIYFIGAFLIKDAMGPEKIVIFSNMVVFSSYAMQVIMSFLMLAFIFAMYPRASVSSDRIVEILDTEHKIIDGQEMLDKDKIEKVVFDKVAFRYPDSEECVLKDISLVANKGETIAFIGSTGSGKSTLINLIPRFYDVTSGNILINDTNIKDYKLESLYDSMGYVSQKAALFNETVTNNIAYGKVNGKKVKQNKVKEALEIAQAEGFVLKMDNKYDAQISEGGTNLSGGQKQRLSIARAIAKDPAIFIFDDSFSALDYKTDYELRKKLKSKTKDSIVFIVAQRIGTILNADKIVVLENGRCVGIGKHKELLKSCKVYSEIAHSQLSKEELDAS